MDVRQALAQRYKAIVAYTGVIFLLAGFLMLTPLAALLAWPGRTVHGLSFALPALALGGLGLYLWVKFHPRQAPTLTAQEGGVVVLISWIVVCLFSAVPFLFISRLTLTQAVFESVSGWTTTGLSVVDVTTAPRVILLWRSVMQFAGGAGLAIIMLTAIAGPPGPALYSAERTEQLVPHVRRSARLVMTLYTGYAVAGVLAYWAAGMDLFDAINHAFAAVSTGGFSTRAASIGHWDSPLIELVTLPLMFLGNLNFLTAYVLLHGRWRTLRHHGELRLASVLFVVCAFVLLLSVPAAVYPTMGARTRAAIFETLTALTTTGFSTTTYANWNALGFLVLIVLMLIGGGTCSTAGGIKQYRIYVLIESILWEVRRSFLPRTAVVENYIWQGDRKDFIDDRRIRQVASFVFFYVATYFIGSGILAAHGYSLSDSLFEFASALGTVGLSVGVTSPTAPVTVLWTETLGMFLGRLEFFVIFIAAAKLIRDAAYLRKGKGQAGAAEC